MQFNSMPQILTTSLLALSSFAMTSVALAHNHCGQSTHYQKINAVQVSRQQFNQIAAELKLPLFWKTATENSASEYTLTPSKISVLWGVESNAKQHDWICNNQFTSKFKSALEQIENIAKSGHQDGRLTADEKSRRELMRQELAQGRPTLIETNLSHDSESERKMVGYILDAAKHIESIYAKQTGTDQYLAEMQKQDTSSQMVYVRNQGVRCVAPATENTPECHSTKQKPNKFNGLYPKELQQKPEFCALLTKEKNAKALMSPFTVVTSQGKSLQALPYSEVYQTEMSAISDLLLNAADSLQDNNEASFKAYLQAASQAFKDNNWLPADEAWSKMSASNSKWFLRIGPDEVYYDTCNLKAGFHLSFARINPASLVWQEKLDPLKSEMEQKIAAHAGTPYQARKVNFHLPDFIDIILNAGNSRSPHGGTIGQSLPNWGPVANEGRGRTVAMTNLYTDVDSRLARAEQAASLLCPATMENYNRGEESVLTTLLHEAAHNLGPAHEYAVNGKNDRTLFGGPLASMLEELKAQTAALYYTDWLAEKALITKDQAQQTHVMDLVWNFGHIAQGMYDGESHAKPYSQLSAIQFGHFMKDGALEWHANEMAANKKDRGCYVINQAKFSESADKLLTTVAGIKARGDKALSEGLKAEYVDNTGAQAQAMQIIASRWLRAPKSSFVYSVHS